MQMPNSTGDLKTIQTKPSTLATSKVFFPNFCRMILATRKGGDWHNIYEQGLLKMTLEDHDVTAIEAYRAWKKAYSDQYTPASGIEWRHLWKQIEEMRMGRDRQYYSYTEMLNICDRENISTDHFEIDPAEKQKQEQTNPNKPTEKIKIWRRK